MYDSLKAKRGPVHEWSIRWPVTHNSNHKAFFIVANSNWKSFAVANAGYGRCMYILDLRWNEVEIVDEI